MLKNPRFAVGVIVVGLILISMGTVWPYLIPQEMVWNPEQATEKSNAAADLHLKTHLAAHAEIDNPTAEEKARLMNELAAAQERFESSRSALDRARLIRDRTATALRWSGIAIAIVGLFQYQLVKPAE